MTAELLQMQTKNHLIQALVHISQASPHAVDAELELAKQEITEAIKEIQRIIDLRNYEV